MPPSSDGNSESRKRSKIDQNVGEKAQQEGDAEHSDNLKIQNPFEMIDTVNLLVKYFDGKSLKSSLMVSKLWNTEGMKIFFKNNYIRVPEDLSFGSEAEEIEMVKKLKTSFSSSCPFPNALIKNPCDIGILQKHDILAGLKHVKVNLEYEGSYKDEIGCVEKVLVKCPNLTFLKCPIFRNEDNTRLMKKCMETGKNGSLTISDLYLKLESRAESFQTIEPFVNSGVRTTNLQLQIDPLADVNLMIRIPELIQKILHSSKECLKELHFGSENTRDRVFSLVKNVPVMEKLEFLDISIQAHPVIEGLPVVFPSGFRFAANCPNLKKFLIDVETHHHDTSYLEKVFASTGPAPSVNCLYLSSSCQFQLDKTCQVFREIEKLTLDPTDNLCLKPVWKFCRHLKSLTLSYEPYSEITFIKVLTQITEHSKDDITRMWKSSVKIPPSPGQPSLLDLQDLEKLQFLGCTLNFQKSKFLLLLRNFTTPHMPKLKTIKM